MYLSGLEQPCFGWRDIHRECQPADHRIGRHPLRLEGRHRHQLCNPSYLQVVNGNSGVAAGSYPGVGSFSISANVNNTAGTIFIGQFTNDNGGDQLAHNTLGSLATITFQVLSGVSLGTMPVVKLNANIGTHNTDVHDYNSNLLTLSPAPDNSADVQLQDGRQEEVVGEQATGCPCRPCRPALASLSRSPLT